MNHFFGRSLFWGGTLVKYFCVAHCTFTYVGNLVLCTGPSMEPTLYSNDILITDCISPLRDRIEHGDIIIAKLPSNPKTLICKRVVGMAGDRLFYIKPTEDSRKHDTINLTSIQYRESLNKEHMLDLIRMYKNKLGMKEVVVPPGQVWVEGDNSSNSGDSRYYGTIPQGLITSRVIARIWPLSEIKVFDNKQI